MATALRALRSSKIPAAGSICYRCSSTSTTTVSAPPANARLRFAPSPTGFLHLGGLRTALFNHLLARKWGGKWILRIEDTDQSRLVDGAVDSLRDTLEWVGLDYDEGIGAGGDHGPYKQSDRLDIYRHYAQELLDKGEAYECFCTPNDLAAIRAGLLKQGHRHGYDGRCRHLSRDDVQQRKKAGHKYVVRLKSKQEKQDLPDDLIFGSANPSTVSSTGADDFVILKSDGWPTYHLASVVDDHLMEISHVLRGEEWLPSVARHHQLYKALGWKPPLFGHLPLLINADGTKLSKRTGDVSVEFYRKKGYEPEALLNFLALMGWDHNAALKAALMEKGIGGELPFHLRDDRHSLYEVFSMPQLIRTFDLGLVNHRRAAVNLGKLEFLNKMTLRREAGLLGRDGTLVNHGKEDASSQSGTEEQRLELIRRYQQSLRQMKVLKESALIEDLDYVREVFIAELPRTIRLSDMAMASIFFYLRPQYSNLESEQFLKELRMTTYIDAIDATLAELTALRDTGRDLSEFDIDTYWDVIHAVVDQLELRRKNELTLPLRHALTGRRSGPGVPQIMQVLGLPEVEERLKSAREYVATLARS